MELYTIKEAALRLAIPESTLTYYCRAGRIGRKAIGDKSRSWIITANENAKFKRAPRGRKKAK